MEEVEKRQTSKELDDGQKSEAERIKVTEDVVIGRKLITTKKSVIKREWDIRI